MTAREPTQGGHRLERRRIALIASLLLLFGILASFLSTAVVPRINQMTAAGDWLEVPVFSKAVFRFHDAVRANLIVFWALIVGSVTLMVAKDRLVPERALLHHLNRAGVIAAYILLTGYLLVTVVALWLPKETFGTGLP